jgi:hypothetical protein
VQQSSLTSTFLQIGHKMTKNIFSSDNESFHLFTRGATCNYLSSFVQIHLDSGMLPTVALCANDMPGLENMWAVSCVVVKTIGRVSAGHP